MKEIRYEGQSITYKRNHLYMGVFIKGHPLIRGIFAKGNPLIREILSTCTDEGRPRIYLSYYYYVYCYQYCHQYSYVLVFV